MTHFVSTAFLDAAHILRQQLREAQVDHEAFEQPLRLCQLNQCRATCCHDGAVLSEDEAAMINEQVATNPQLFPVAKELPFIARREGTLKTSTQPARTNELAYAFPSHFPQTRCVFLDEEHKCTLQLHSMTSGQHPWFYKPLACWMHPILLSSPASNERPCLTVLGPDEDEARFASCTPCGRIEESGPPAKITLEAELKALSQIADRDFLAELNAPTL